MKPNQFVDPARDCDAIRELIPDYAFGLTDADETFFVEANLEYCPGAAAQLADFRSLQDEMRANVPEIEPSAQLGERLMAAIVAPVAAVPAAPAVPLKPRLKRIPLGWVAAGAAVIALVGSNVYWISRVNQLARRPSQPTMTRVIAQEQDAQFVLTGASDLHWVRLPSSEQNANASAVLMWNAASEIGLLYVQGFPSLSAGRTYQLWLTRDQERVSAGTFRVDPDGTAALLFHSSEPIDEYTWARITAEPESGSDQPTGNAVVNGEL
jgi:hypothetical protein